MRPALLVVCLAACTASMPAAQLELQLDEQPPTHRSEPPGLSAKDLAELGPTAPVQPKASPVPPTPMQLVAGARGRTIGADGPGKVEWLSRDARLAVIATAGGRARTCLGEAARATRTLHDLTTGAAERIDRIVALDPRGRHVVVHVGRHMWLIDAATGAREDLAGRGPLLDGGDPCSIRRRAAFDAFGTRLAYLRDARIVVRDLATATETEVPAPAGRLWRAEPAASDGWVRVFTISGDSDDDGRVRLPQAPDDCEGGTCLSPGRRGPYGGGDQAVSHTIELAGDRRHIVGDGDPRDFGVTPVGPDTYGRLTGSSAPLVDAKLQVLPLPGACDGAAVRDGVPALLLAPCNDDPARLWWPHTDRGFALPGGDLLEPAVHRDASADLWIAATIKLAGQHQLVRIDARSGDAFAGPRVLLAHGPLYTERDLSRPDRDGWVLLNSKPGLFAFNLATGAAHIHTGVLAEQMKPGAVQIHRRWHAVDPARGRIHALPDEPAAVAENGCALIAAGYGADFGPWTLSCPQ